MQSLLCFGGSVALIGPRQKLEQLRLDGREISLDFPQWMSSSVLGCGWVPTSTTRSLMPWAWGPPGTLRGTYRRQQKRAVAI